MLVILLCKGTNYLRLMSSVLREKDINIPYLWYADAHFPHLSMLLNLCKRLFKVGDDVVDVFHADGETHRGWGDVLLFQFLRTEL